MAKRHLDEMDNYDYLASNSNLPEVVVTAKAPKSFARLVPFDYQPNYGTISKDDRSWQRKLTDNIVGYLKNNKTNSLIKNVNNIWNDIDFNTKTRLAHGVHAAHNASNPIDAIDRFVYSFGYTPKIEPGNAFLLNDEKQEKYMNSLGYFKTDDEDGIKKINKAVSTLKKYRNDDKINIYQIGRDVVPRDSVVPINLNEVPKNLEKNYINGYGLKHAGAYPTIYYKHVNPLKNEYFYRDIDLNDYGNHDNRGGVTYGTMQYVADLYDKIGNPFIQKTGIRRMTEKQPYTVLKDRRFLKNGGTIYIKPENRGKFNATKERTGKNYRRINS